MRVLFTVRMHFNFMELHLLINGLTSYATEVVHILHFVLYKFQDSRYFVEVREVFVAEVSAGGEIMILSLYSKGKYTISPAHYFDSAVFSHRSVYFSHPYQIEHGCRYMK